MMPRLYGLVIKPSESTPFVPPPEGEIWHLQHAALDAEAKDKDYATLQVKTSESIKYSMGTLRCASEDFMKLDLPIAEYVEFSVTGTAAIHLTGYLASEDGGDMLFDEDAEDMEVLQAVMQNGAKRRIPNDEDSEEDEDSDEESEEEDEEPQNLVQIEEIPMEVAAKAVVEEKVQKPEEKVQKEGTPTRLSKSAAKKLKRKQKKEAAKKASAVEEPIENTSKKQKTSDEIKVSPSKTKSMDSKSMSSKKKSIRRFTNGYVIETVQSGPEVGDVVTRGKKVTIKYVGKLESGKMFDETRGDRTFTFTYGSGEVIKGLDKGLDDMRVGDKRKLTIPPKMGYGAEGAVPAIPPNAQLLFEVELTKIG